MVSSRFSADQDAWDLIFAIDENDSDPLTLMMVDDNDVAPWEGGDAPALANDRFVYREQAVMWQPTLGCGYSRRTAESTGTGSEGQIISGGTSYGRNATFVVPGIVMPAGALTAVPLPTGVIGVTGRITDSVEYGTNKDLWFSTGGRYAVKVASGNGVLSTQDFGASYTTKDLQIFDSKMYVSGGSSGVLQELSGSTWTAAAANCKALSMERVNWLPSNIIMGGSGGGTPADHLLLVDVDGIGYRHVVSGNDVKVFANWISVAGAPIAVGDAQYPIKSIVASPRVVWFSKPNGLHGVTEIGRAVNLTPWVERTFNENNGAAVAFYSDDERAFVFYAHQFGLVVVTVNGTQQETARFVQFGGRTANETPVWGRPRSFAAHVDGIFVAYYDGTASYVMRLILEKDGSYRWSGSECTITGEEVTYMKVTSPAGKPRLWIATVDSSGFPKLYWQSLPESGNPWVDYQAALSHTFATDWSVYVPRDDAGSSAQKVVRRYDIVARGIGDGNLVAVSAAADDSSYEPQGSVIEGARASFTASTEQTGVWFNWRLDVTNTTTAPVVLETFQARVTLLPEQSDVFTFRVQLSAGAGILNSNVDIRDPYTLHARIRGLQRLGPILMIRSPLSRETLPVKVEQGARMQAFKSRKTGDLTVVEQITVSVLQQGAIYDTDIYNGTAEYGADS